MSKWSTETVVSQKFDPDTGAPKLRQMHWLVEGEEKLAAFGGEDLDLERAKLAASSPELLEALKGLFELIERGDLVKDITRDGDPDWAKKMLDFVPRLKRAQLAIAKAEGRE
jgi:hypothetical protein